MIMMSCLAVYCLHICLSVRGLTFCVVLKKFRVEHGLSNVSRRIFVFIRIFSFPFLRKILRRVAEKMRRLSDIGDGPTTVGTLSLNFEMFRCREVPGQPAISAPQCRWRACCPQDHDLLRVTGCGR